MKWEHSLRAGNVATCIVKVTSNLDGRSLEGAKGVVKLVEDDGASVWFLPDDPSLRYVFEERKVPGAWFLPVGWLECKEVNYEVDWK